MSNDANKKAFEIRFENSVTKKAPKKAYEIIDAQPGLTEKQKEDILDQQFKKWLARFIFDFNTDTIDTGILLFYGDIHLSETTWTQLPTIVQP